MGIFCIAGQQIWIAVHFDFFLIWKNEIFNFNLIF